MRTRQVWDDVQELEEDLEVVGCNRQDFDWAVSVLHSRCFIQGPQSIHMTVPGVDMANHSFSPNATVRCPLLCWLLLNQTQC